MSFHPHFGRLAAAVAALILATGVPARADQDAAPPSPAPGVAIGRVLSLDDAIRLTREAHPALRAAGLASEAARARVRDAGRFPDPSLSAALENLGGGLGTDRAETSLLLEQPIELGGDRAARAGVARATADLSLAQRDLLSRALEGETAERFCDVWALQERVTRLREAEIVAERAVAAAEERLKAGAAPAFERTRAQGFRDLRGIERRRAEAELESARELLARQWGAEAAGFDSVSLPEPAPFALPALEELIDRTRAHPGARAAAAERDAERWRLREVRAARTPDLQVGAGIRHLAEAGGTGLLVGLSLPLPIWNRQAGSVAAAESQLAAATERERQTALELRGELRRAHRRVRAALSAWEGIRDRVRPAADEALRLVSAGYRAGRLTHLEIQEGQRNLLEADLLLIEAAADVWRARSAFERVVSGSPGGTVPAKEDR